MSEANFSSNQEILMTALQSSFCQKFKSKPRLFFITVQPYKKSKNHKKLQKIGKINDWIRKYSDTFLIVQETNKGAQDKHYHILASLNKKPRDLPDGFKQSAHMRIYTLKVGKNTIREIDYFMQFLIPNPTEKFEKKDTFSTPKDRANYVASMIRDYWRKSEKKKKKNHKILVKKNNISKIILYCFKEIPDPYLYENYIFKLKK